MTWDIQKKLMDHFFVVTFFRTQNMDLIIFFRNIRITTKNFCYIFILRYSLHSFLHHLKDNFDKTLLSVRAENRKTYLLYKNVFLNLNRFYTQPGFSHSVIQSSKRFSFQLGINLKNRLIWTKKVTIARINKRSFNSAAI